MVLRTFTMKSSIVTLICILMITLSLNAQVQSGAYNLMLKTMLSHSVPEISVEQFTNENLTSNNYVLVDTREKVEYDVSHIKGAFWVGYDDFNINRLPNIPKDTLVILYCSVGYRSEKIGEKLKNAGFTNVKNLYGGFFEYLNEGNTPVDNQGKNTNKVHAYSKTWGIWLNKGEKVYTTKD